MTDLTTVAIVLAFGWVVTLSMLLAGYVLGATMMKNRILFLLQQNTQDAIDELEDILGIQMESIEETGDLRNGHGE